jgi:hypothetical protein
MELGSFIFDIANVLKDFDSEKPIHKHFSLGIGPFGEPQLVKEISNRLNQLKNSYKTKTKRTPDLDVNGEWAIEVKIVRPFGDNGHLAENWSVNMLHPYEGNASVIGDVLKLKTLEGYSKRAVIVIAYEHAIPKINLDTLISSFELIMAQVIHVKLKERIEEKRENLVHPVHQTVRCISWELE